MENNEQWRPLFGHIERIEVSTLGRIKIHNYRGTEETRIIERREAYDSRPYTSFHFNNRHIDIHKAVVMTFPDICGKWSKGKHIHHKNGNKTDNRAENLCVLSPAEHRKLHPLTEEDIRKMSEAQKGDRNGFFGKHHSEKTRRRWSELRKGKTTWNKGRKMSEEVRRKNSEVHKGLQTGIKNGMFGRHRTDAEKEAIRRAQSVPVSQYDLDNNFIRTWPSMVDAQRHLGILHIGDCCRGVVKTAGGFIWRYATS